MSGETAQVDREGMSEEPGDRSLAFLHERALDAARPLTDLQRRLIEAVRHALLRADGLVVCLGGQAGRLGECIVGTALLEGILQAVQALGKAGTPLHIVVDAGAAELFDARLYQQRNWPAMTIQFVPFEQSAAALNDAARSLSGEIVVLDCSGARDGMPEVRHVADTSGERRRHVTRIGPLFRVGVRSYAARGPLRRYADFVQELFGLAPDPIDGEQAQPRLLLSEDDDARYPALAGALGLRPDTLQVVGFFQSVVPAKWYERWDEVLALLGADAARYAPGAKIDVLAACGPDTAHAEGMRRADIEREFGGAYGVDGNVHVTVAHVPSLRDLAILVRHAALVLADDTGPGHIAGALGVPVVTPYLPGSVYSMEVWASSRWHRGVTLEPNPYSFEEIKNAVLWDSTYIIDSIAPERLVEAARDALFAGLSRLPKHHINQISVADS